jgi:uncharacterized protein
VAILTEDMKRLVSERGSLVEINVIDPFVRKGYRFKGPAVIHEPGTDGFVEGLGRLRQEGSKLVDRVNAVVVIEVQQAWPLVSPAYDDGTTSEAEMARTFDSLRPAPRAIS